MGTRTIGGACRACGALARYLNGTWVLADPNARCRYGAPVHSDMTESAHTGRLILSGQTRLPAGDNRAVA